MAEPNEPLKGLIVPNTGDLVGAWGTTALNANFQAIGGITGGVLSLSLSAATTIALGAPSGSITPGAGPTQQQNFMISCSGTQTGTAILKFSLPGRYVIDNQCIGTSFPVVCAPASGGGTQIGVPWGRKCPITFDGTNVDFENPPDPGTAIDLHGWAGIPVWMLACSKQYAVIKDGFIYNVSSFPALAAQLGSTFGGNGVTTFGVPDELNRMRLPIDIGSNGGFRNRVTSGGSGINGQALGASGGNELLQSHTHANSLTDPGHSHTTNAQVDNGVVVLAGGGAGHEYNPATATINPATTGITITNAAAGGGGSQNMVPTIVSFIALIKT